MLKLVFKNIEPVSVNKLYCGKGRRFITPEAKKFKTEFVRRVKAANINLTELKKLKGKRLKMEIVIESASWLLKDKKTIRRKDGNNYFKAICDSLFDGFEELLGSDILDDKQIWIDSTQKLVGEEENIYITLTTID